MQFALNNHCKIYSFINNWHFIYIYIYIYKYGSLKLVDKFTYLGSSVSSTENYINTWLAKTWKPIDWISVILRSDMFDKIKPIFFQAEFVSILLYGCTSWMLTKCIETKLDGNCPRMQWAVMNKSWKQYLTNQQQYHHLSHISKTIKYDERGMLDTAGEVRTNS